MKTPDQIDLSEPVSPYQARLYGAVIHGYDRGRRRTDRLFRILWLSRRRLQAENVGLRARIELVEELCGRIQMLDNNPHTKVRADWINHAIHPDLYPEPADMPPFMRSARPNEAKQQ